MPTYTANQGDCISSIAENFGFYWKTIWDHPENTTLKARRKDPNVLLEGDRIFIPDLRVMEVPAATDQVHRFVRKGVPAKVRLRLLDFQQNPRAGLPYTANVDGRYSEGETDSTGLLEIPAPPNAKTLKLIVTEGQRSEEYTIALGRVDPIEETTGIQQRLRNLGFPCPDTDAEQTASALRAFQKEMNLAVTGELDSATRERLLSTHGC